MFSLSIDALYVRWLALRALFSRGWWLVTSLYLVVEANLSPFELVLIGTLQGISVLAMEIPTGVLADTISRKWSVVISHLLMGTGMLATGLVTDFWLLVLTQMLWGVAWTFTSGADVAWLTDELDDENRTAQVLTRGARYEQVGSACGLAVFGLLGWWLDLNIAMILAGIAILLLGLIVAVVFPEKNFKPHHSQRLRASAGILRDGLKVARQSRTVLVIFSCTFLLHGALEAFGRWYVRGLVDLGMPPSPAPIVWLTLLGIVTLLVTYSILQLLENRLAHDRLRAHWYAAAMFAGAIGCTLFVTAPSFSVAVAGVVLVRGIADGVARTISIIWTNSHANSQSRATLQSLLSVAENAGEIVLGFSLAILSGLLGLKGALVIAAALMLITMLLSAWESRRH